MKQTIIAIDYDDTYSKYPQIFDRLRESFQSVGALVYIVTARCESSPIKDDLSAFDRVIYTEQKAKASVVNADIYIDDNPVTLCCDLSLEHISDSEGNRLCAYPAGDLHQHYGGDDYKWHFSNGRFTPQKERG